VILLGLTRVLVSALLLYSTVKLLLKLRSAGYFADFFYMPLVPEALVPSAGVYTALLALKVAACLLSLLGLASRPALLAAAAIGLYLMLCDRLQYHNNHYVAHLVALLLAFTRCDRSFLAIRRLRSPRSAEPDADPNAVRGPVWAVHLIKVQLALVYLTSGGSKLLDADWRGGEVMRLRYLMGVDVVQGRGYEVPDSIRELLGSALFASLTSKAAIATELFLAVGLLVPRTRIPALWVGVLFHLGIQIFAKVDLFSWLMLSAYVLYATPEIRQRTLHFDPEVPRARRAARVVAACDWLLRYRIVPSRNTASGADPGAPLCLVDRDGSLVTGRGVWLTLFRSLPPLFPLWLPARVLQKVLARRRRERGSATSHH